MRIVEILSNGSLNFTLKKVSKLKQLIVYEKDNKNFSLNKKPFIKINIKSNYSFLYRKKYI